MAVISASASISCQARIRAAGGSLLYALVNDPRLVRVYTAEIEYWGRLPPPPPPPKLMINAYAFVIRKP